MLDPLTSLVKHNHEAIVSGAIMTVLTTIAVILRLLSKSITRRFTLDDWLIIAAQLLWYIQYGLQLYALLQGRQATAETDPHFSLYLKYIYLYADFYFCIVLLTNLSILSFYRSVFGTSMNRVFNYLSLGLGLAQVLWCLVGSLVEVFICTPIQSFWLTPQYIPEKCIYYSSFWLVMMLVELVFDFAILSLPLQETLKLKLSPQNKIALSCIFLLGSFVLVTGIVRIAASWERGYQVIDLVLDIFWLDIHLGTAIICACLPTYRSLLTKSISVVSSSVKKYSSSGSNSKSGDKVSSGSSSRPVLPIFSNAKDHGNYSQFSGDEVDMVAFPGSPQTEKSSFNGAEA